jgi:hypothetical protein
MIGQLAEIGYDQDKHDAGIGAITATTLPAIIEAVTEVYRDLYDQSPAEINCGNCEEFAHDVKDAYGCGEPLWHDEMPDCSDSESVWWAHKFLEVDGRFYDSECPEGVDNWRELPCFANNPISTDTQ